MHLRSYLQSASEILLLYRGEMPFASWLKMHFKANKKFGSRDRKMITDLCYCYYRLGNGWLQKSVEERLLTAQFLCNEESVFVREFKPEWTAQSNLPVKEKIHLIAEAEGASLFPFLDEVSSQIDKELFAESHLIQPDLFLRVRPGNKNAVLKKLEAASLHFSAEENCVRLPNMSKVDEIIELDEEAAVQDKSSQKVLDNLLPAAHSLPPAFSMWDCCAASGGKSILLHDFFPEAQLTVSDIRESILHNLRTRFKKAGIGHYTSFIADVSSPTFSLKQKFDVIICDAPCSGSGTWSRTPEQLSFFSKNKIAKYASLQKAIAVNSVKSLKKGGYFLYITCSVFQKENEDVVEYIAKNTSLKLVKQEYFKGYAEKADALFTALFLL